MPIQKVTSGIIADGAIVATDIADGTVTGPKLGLTSINANNIVNASITGDKITVGSLAGNVFTANTVTGDKIGQNAVSSNNIIASVTLTTPQLSGNLISSTNSSIRFVSTNAYDGQQNSKIQWINENQNGVMAQISGIREQNAGAPGALGFYTNSNVDSGGYTPTERMRVTSGGFVGIGSTNPGSLLEVNAGSGFSSSGVIARFFGTSGNSLLIRGSGNCENTNGAFGAISDAKLKENIVDATPKLDKVNQLKVRNYNLIGDELKQIGFVAQEIEQVFPGIVSDIPDVDAEGNDLGTTTKTVKTTVLIPILVKAIQEQQAMIEELKTKVTALENANK